MWDCGLGQSNHLWTMRASWRLQQIEYCVFMWTRTVCITCEPFNEWMHEWHSCIHSMNGCTNGIHAFIQWMDAWMAFMHPLNEWMHEWHSCIPKSVIAWILCSYLGLWIRTVYITCTQWKHPNFSWILCSYLGLWTRTVYITRTQWKHPNFSCNLHIMWCVYVEYKFGIMKPKRVHNL